MRSNFHRLRALISGLPAEGVDVGYGRFRFGRADTARIDLFIKLITHVVSSPSAAVYSGR